MQVHYMAEVTMWMNKLKIFGNENFNPQKQVSKYVA